MKYSVEIGKIVEGALSHNNKKMINYTELLIDNLERDKEKVAVRKFQKLLNKSKMTTLNPMNAKSVPVDKESRSNLIDVHYPRKGDYDVILNSNNKKELNSFILGYEKRDELFKEGIDISNNLILFGSPGTGKTQTAYYIASELDLPLYVTRLDSLISSYLGTTAKNIQTVFQYAESSPSILFIDEFDAIAKARDDENELGELKRVVNSLIQNIDYLSKNHILIVATNHERLLDIAVWRRFNTRIKIDLPDQIGIIQMIKIFNGNRIIMNEDEILELSEVLIGLSGADIKEIIVKTIKNNIIYNKEQTIESIYENYFSFISTSEKNNSEREYNKFKAKHLREKNNKIFTYKRIGEILEVSTSSIAMLIKED